MGRASTCNGTLINLGGGRFQIAGDGYLANTSLPFINGMAQCDYTEVDPEAGIFEFGQGVLPEPCQGRVDIIDLIYDTTNTVFTDVLDVPISATIGDHASLVATIGKATTIQASLGSQGIQATIQETRPISATISDHATIQGVITC